MAPLNLLVTVIRYILVIAYQIVIIRGSTYAVTTPIRGVFTRWRAHYRPKVVQLVDGVADNPNKPANLFQTVGRVYRLEGWEGFYKGLMPEIIRSILTNVAALIINVVCATGIDFQDLRGEKYRGKINEQFLTPYDIALNVLEVSPVFLATFALLPLDVIKIRSITTPFRLPFFKPEVSLRTLLTPAEREHPWILYKTPGLVLAVILRAAVLLGAGPGIQLLSDVTKAAQHASIEVRGESKGSCVSEKSSLIDLSWRIAFSALGFVMTLLLLTALDVIATKLSVQRNGLLSPPLVETEATPAPKDQVEEYSTEDVIESRNVPYTSLIDCGKKVVAEEGWKTLFRLWWVNVVVVSIRAKPVFLSLGDEVARRLRS